MSSDDHHTGEEVLHTATVVAREVFGDRLNAVFALGSLAHGGFAPVASDIDIALILQELTDDTPTQVDRVRQRSIAKASTPLAERLSIFWSDWHGVHHGPAGLARLPAVDRLDLLDHGRLLLGHDERARATRPAVGTLVVEGAEFACARFDDAYFARLHEPDRLVADGARTVTKTVLFPIRFLYTLNTGRIGHNAHAVDWYRSHGAYPVLADAAMSWRERGIADPAAATELLHSHLVAVYEEFFDAYTTALDVDGHTVAADDLRERRRSLSAYQTASF